MLLVLGAASLAVAADPGNFGVRIRGVYVKPSESFDSRLSGARLNVSDDVVPGLDLEYFFMKNVSAEFNAAVTHHDIKSDGQFVGTTWLLPPSLTVKYHPLAGQVVSPYAGAGINVTFPFNSKLNSALNPSHDFSVDNTVGYVLQAGLDIKIKDNVYLNVDYKYLNVDTKIKIEGVKYKMDLNPNLFGIGIGYRF